MQRLGAALEIPPEDHEAVRDMANQIFQAIANAEDSEIDRVRSSAHILDNEQANMQFFRGPGEEAEGMMMEEGNGVDVEARQISEEVDTSLQMSVVEGDGADVEGQQSRPRLPIRDRVLRTFWFDWLNRLWA